ncbi:hypothetical protein ElyMa_002079600 [Elysia marginata]|uniref:Uncharacterized protein n=1 Tax=Elysia marginata TaxID=1093978 RepID=A0AAV4FCE6_9GAST|nr:hypothetical protein ElyMa_002079600 [Elysia marginata]
MRPHLVDSGTFISPVDGVSTRSGLSQVVVTSGTSNFDKKSPHLSLVASGSNHVFTFETHTPKISLSSSRVDRRSVIDPYSVRPTLLSPPPLPSFRSERRTRVISCLVGVGALVLLLVLVVILATI